MKTRVLPVRLPALRKIKKLTLLIIGGLCFGVSGFAETETTRKDFNTFAAAHLGLWAGEVASVIGESVVGEKGDTETYYWESKLANDGKLLIHKATGPTGSSTLMGYYDVVAKKIRVTGVSSNGLVNQHKIHREGEKWIRLTHQTAPDGTIREFMSTITWSANTITVVINRMKAESIISTQTNVWHRVE